MVLTSILEPHIEARAGLPFTILGTFVVGNNLTVRVGSKDALSGVSGRPYTIVPVRSDRITAYLPLVDPAIYSVTVIDTSNGNETDVLSNALFVDPAPKISSIEAFRRSWGPRWKVGR